MAVFAACTGSISTSLDGAAICSVPWIEVPLEVVAGSRIDSEDYAILFGAAVSFFLIGFAVKMILRLLLNR